MYSAPNSSGRMCFIGGFEEADEVQRKDADKTPSEYACRVGGSPSNPAMAQNHRMPQPTQTCSEASQVGRLNSVHELSTDSGNARRRGPARAARATVA